MENSGIMQFIPFIFVFLIMYFLMIRPQNKKQKELQKLRDSLKGGDSVILSSGIHGKVVSIGADNVVKVKIDSSCTVKVERSSITTVNGTGGEVASKPAPVSTEAK